VEQDNKNTVTSAPKTEQPLEAETPAAIEATGNVILIALIIILSIPAIGIIWLALSFSGGLDGWLDERKGAPDANSPKIVQKREDAKKTINSSFDEIKNGSGLNQYASSFHDRCYKGEHSWKRNDSYAYRCSYLETRYYGFSDDFRQKILDFDDVLKKNGWEMDFPGYRGSISEVINDYYDEYYNLTDNPYTSDILNDKYLVSDLPDPSAFKKMTLFESRYGSSAEYQYLHIDVAEKNTKYPDPLVRIQEISVSAYDSTYEKKEIPDMATIHKQITEKDKYVLVVSIQKDYYEN
jgi:hypothetical protein